MMSNSNKDNNYKLLKRFIDFDLLSQNHQETEVIDEDYINLLNIISSETKKNIKRSFKRLKRIDDVVFDGNVPLDGYSPNEKIAKLQKDALEIMEELSESNDLPKISVVALNSAFSNALSVPDQDEVFYQKIYKDKDDRIVTSKLDNVFIYPSRILTLLKDAYLLGTYVVGKNLFLFCWTFMEFINKLKMATKITLTYNEVIVLLYIQKYAVPFIEEDDLKRHVSKKDLCFDVNENVNSYNMSEEEVSDIVGRLDHLEIISLEDGKIRLTETILL